MTTDIDECEEDNDGCAQTCTDTEGSYNCSCGPGYTLASDDHGCDGECVELDVNSGLSMHMSFESAAQRMTILNIMLLYM